MSNSLLLLILAGIALACLGIAIYMVVTKQASSPHQIVELAGKGNRIAKTYVGLFAGAVLVFLLLVINQIV